MHYFISQSLTLYPNAILYIPMLYFISPCLNFISCSLFSLYPVALLHIRLPNFVTCIYNCLTYYPAVLLYIVYTDVYPATLVYIPLIYSISNCFTLIPVPLLYIPLPFYTCLSIIVSCGIFSSAWQEIIYARFLMIFSILY